MNEAVSKDHLASPKTDSPSPSQLGLADRHLCWGGAFLLLFTLGLLVSAILLIIISLFPIGEVQIPDNFPEIAKIVGGEIHLFLALLCVYFFTGIIASIFLLTERAAWTVTVIRGLMQVSMLWSSILIIAIAWEILFCLEGYYELGIPNMFHWFTLIISCCALVVIYIASRHFVLRRS